jgi:orotidine-5'-phosphate decarboxylase
MSDDDTVHDAKRIVSISRSVTAEQPPVIFALDFARLDEARAAAAEVSSAIGMVKVGLELFVSDGPAALAVGRDIGLPVFLDLKLHDIPETVERAVAQAAALGARVVTVHAAGGREMLRRAVERTKGTWLAVCAVTVLTSLDDRDLGDIGLSGPTEYAVVRLAKMAFEEGVRWFVCSPAEVARVRAALGPEAVLVTPGVRPAGSDAGDQKRIATPAQAISDGASWVVIGRPIRDAPDRLQAALSIAQSIAVARG